MMASARVQPSSCIATCGQCIKNFFAHLTMASGDITEHALETVSLHLIVQPNNSTFNEKSTMIFELVHPSSSCQGMQSSRSGVLFQSAAMDQDSESCLLYSQILSAKLQIPKGKWSIGAYFILVEMDCSGEVQVLSHHLPLTQDNRNLLVPIKMSDSFLQLKLSSWHTCGSKTLTSNQTFDTTEATTNTVSTVQQLASSCIMRIDAFTTTGSHSNAGLSSQSSGHVLHILHSKWLPLQLALTPGQDGPVKPCGGNWWSFDLSAGGQYVQQLSGSCLQVGKIQGVYVQAASDDAWQIASNVILARTASGSTWLLTADLGTALWVDTNALDTRRAMQRMSPADPCIAKMFENSLLRSNCSQPLMPATSMSTRNAQPWCPQHVLIVSLALFLLPLLLQQ